MADPQITTMLANTVRITAPITATVIDDAFVSPGHTVTFFPTATTDAPVYVRTLLADPGHTGGTELTALELLTHVETILGSSLWTLSLGSTGLVTITYDSGNADTASIAWTTIASNGVRMLLGFTQAAGTLTFVDGGANTRTAGNPPTHVGYAFAVTGDTGWHDGAQQVAAADLPDGTVYGWGDNKHRVKRTLTVRWVPKDLTTKLARVSYATQALPYASTEDAAHTTAVSPSQAAGVSTIWSWWHLVKTALSDGTNCGAIGFASGTFQAVRLRTGYCDVAYLSAKTHAADGLIHTPPEDPYWDEMRDVGPLEMTRATVLDIS